MRFILYIQVMIIIIGTLIVPSVLAISPNQYDDFEISSTHGWSSGFPNPNPPQNISSGGPLGTDDNFLQVTSIGGSGAGSRLVVFNSTQWSGNYISSGVQAISMYIKNFSDTTLSMRIVIRGPGGDFWSAVPLTVSDSADWHPITFSLLPSDLIGGTDLTATLSAVSSIRILHSDFGGFTGNPIAAQIGLDNISASTQPLPFQIALTLLVEGFYDGISMIPDTVKVEIRNSSSPYSLKDQQFVTLDNLGQGSGVSLVLENLTPYLIVVKHRNSIETWSASPVLFSFGYLNYNFTTDAAKAFGDNMKLKGSKWTIFSGDVNQDGLVDLSDVSLTDIDNLNFATGYTATDVNGDNLVDLSDLSIVDINNLNFVSKVTPTFTAKPKRIEVNTLE